MNERDFVYWMQGFFELSNSAYLDERQTKIIKDHLQLVFKKVTPVYLPPKIEDNDYTGNDYNKLFTPHVGDAAQISIANTGQTKYC